MFLLVVVILFTRRVCPEGGLCPGGLRPGVSVHGAAWMETPSFPWQPLQQSVHILLECILVHCCGQLICEPRQEIICQ